MFRIFLLFFSLIVLSACSYTAQNSENCDEIYVADTSQIMVYNRTDTGNIAPKRVIAGANPNLSMPAGLAIDTINNEIFVVDRGNNSIKVFQRAAKGDQLPIRKITGLNAPYGIAVDPFSDLIYVTFTSNDAVQIFDRLADGNASQLRLIGGPLTQISGANGIFLDLSHNELILGNITGVNVSTLTTSDVGNFAPTRNIVGAATGITDPYGVSISTYFNELITLNSTNISSYTRTSTGNTAPVRTIAGAATGLNTARGLFLDAYYDELFISNQGAKSIIVFNRSDDGNLSPKRSIGGALTQLNAPVGISVASCR